MRRVTAITALALFLAVPAWAQHSGGHAGGFGGRGTFSGGHVVGGSSFSGMRGPSGPIIAHGFTHLPSSRATLSRRPFLHEGFRDSRFRDRAFHDRRFRCVGCWSFGSPWWWDSGSSYDEDYERERALAAEMNARNLEEQQMLRQEQADRDHYAYARPPRREQERPELETAADPYPPTVLVFRDQHKQEVQNYAIVGQTFWAFAPQRQKIPLSDLDLAATTKANDDRGVTFRVPAANEAQ